MEINFKEELGKYQEIVNKALEKYLRTQDCPEKVLNEAMEYSLMAGGKRLRPILMLVVYQIFKKDYTALKYIKVPSEEVKKEAIKMSYDALKQIKSIDERIKTGYVLTIAYGNFYNLDYCDAFSINSAYVNKKMVDAIHNRGKKIFVWTVNSSSKAKEMTEIGVDAIITDNPVMTREIVYSKYNNPLFKNVLDYVFR